MATVNQDNQDPNQQAPAGGPVNISGTAGASASAGQGASGAPGAASPVSANTPQTNQGYTDVGSYLDANKAGAEQMGNQVAGNLNTKYGDVTKGIDKSGNDFIDSVNMGYTKAQDTSGMLANAVQTASDPNQVSAFQGQLNDKYTGPSSYGDYGTQQGKVSQAQQYAGLTNTPGGTNVLAQGLEGPQASQGVNQLDTMLLNGSPGASQAMQAAAKPFDTLGSYLDQYNTTGNNAIAANTAEANGAAQSAQSGLAGAQANLQGSVTGALGKAQGEYTAANNGLAGIQGTVNNNGTLTPEQLSNLGVDPKAYANYMSNMNGYQTAYGSAPMNEGSLFTAGTSPMGAPTAANSASANDYAQSAALGTLAGQGNYPTNPLNAADAGQAGKANTGLTPSKFDVAGGGSKAQLDFANKDVDYLLGSKAGPMDSFKGAGTDYNTRIQQAAQAALTKVKQFGQGYYPQVDQKWMDAMTRLATNSYKGN